MNKVDDNLILNKASFQSVIGKIYYLWIEPETDKRTGHKACIQSRLSYLGNKRKSLECYIEKLKRSLSSKYLLILKEKKSGEIENCILNYLSGKSTDIDLDIYFLSGTDFEKKVWKTAVSISYGKTLSYMELAARAGSPSAWRAAGTALGHNPIMLAVPCHRIIKSNGLIGNFGGGIKVKEFLLNLEALNKKDKKFNN